MPLTLFQGLCSVRPRTGFLDNDRHLHPLIPLPLQLIRSPAPPPGMNKGRLGRGPGMGSADDILAAPLYNPSYRILIAYNKHPLRDPATHLFPKDPRGNAYMISAYGDHHINGSLTDALSHCRISASPKKSLYMRISYGAFPYADCSRVP